MPSLSCAFKKPQEHRKRRREGGEGLRGGGGNRDLARTTGIIGEVCEALEHMTGHDLYHRDVKPSNIILHPERGAVLIDFGLAKEVVAGEDVSLSKGASEGWSPPERARGVSGPFTDVYSLGQVLWHMLTGEDPGIIREDDRRERLEAAGQPAWLAGLIIAATVPDDPRARIQTVLEFRILLQNEGELPG